MLQYISVKNFAIIENIEVDFQSGMTALTGETGAGKSLLIDAIGLLLGDRATSNIVRTGSQKAEIEGIFIIESERLVTLLKEMDLYEGRELLIRRQITPSNNNVIKVNNHTVTLQQLNQITQHLADIHTQHDTHRLINPQTYIDIIDGFHQEESNELLSIYKEKREHYLTALKELDHVKVVQQELEERFDLMTFQIKELEEYNLDQNEEEELETTISKMKNHDAIFQHLKEVISLLNQDNAVDRIYDASKELERIESYGETYGQLKDRISSTYYELSDAVATIQDELSNMDFDPRELDAYQQRLNTLDRLKRKYRKTIPELIEHLETIKQDVSNIEHYDDVIKEKESIVISCFRDVSNIAKRLSNRRQETGMYIAKELLAILSDLELKNTTFQVDFAPVNMTDPYLSSIFLEDGIDTIDFLISTNVGEPLKSLSKTASGGEMSRIMLGLKYLLVQSLQLALIIFDEIDSGVSGFVAHQVANKMKHIASSTQVLCITHIPQVAAISHHHLYIEKHVEHDRTKASIKSLHGEERIKEIATMISGERVTDAAIASARELLQ